MKNHYKERIVDLLENNMTEKAFKLWKGIDSLLPDIWSKLTASTKKYHKKLNGEVPDIAEHVYHMIYAGIKVLRMFDIESKTSDADKILFAIALHDSVKYGNLGTRKYCDNAHDKEAADMIASNESTFRKLLTEEQFQVMEEAIRFHSGKWSTDVPKNKKFDWKQYNSETLFIHMLDMLSSSDLIQTDVRD
jgi:hypothetical protein